MSDDLDEEGLDIDESSFDDFEEKPRTLGDAWRENPALKVGAVVAGVVVIFIIANMFGGEEAQVNQSIVSGGSEISAPPGTEEATQAYVDAVIEENEARTDEAWQTGGSVLPTPTDPAVGRLSVPEEEIEEEDPLQRWRQLQEERIQKELQQQTETVSQGPVAAADDGSRSEAIQALADTMAQQMQSILESQSEFSLGTMNITSPDALEIAQGKNGDEGDGSDDFFEDEDLEGFEEILMPAGEIVYAQLLIEANSDLEGPVLAEIVSGPLAGSRILGSFTLEEESELLVLNFSTVIVDGISLDTSAIAIDPETTLPGMASDVDHRYFRRIILPAAAAFIEGAAGAIAESGRTDITITGDTVTSEEEETDSEQEIASGIEEVGQELREILDDEADVEILVRLEAGTPMGILFLEPVVEETE